MNVEENDDDVSYPYPTEEELEYIKKFAIVVNKDGSNNIEDLFNYVHNLWAYAGWGWHENDGDSDVHDNMTTKVYTISTAGWSGNEDLIRALESNWVAWSVAWYSSRVGGHYEFRVDKIKPEANDGRNL